MAVNPTGPGLSLLVVTIILLLLSWLTVILRFLVRWSIKAVGLDDWLMGIGLICFSITCSFIITSIYNGAGTRAENLNDYYMVQGRKWYTYAQIIYCLTTIPIKGSICVALLRIATKKIFKYILYGIMTITVLSSIAIDIVIISWCRPLPAAWGAVPGKCGPATTNANVGYFYSAVCILTDWMLAILPAVMLHDIQLKRRVKVSVAFVLALGAFASTATIIRLRYLVLYNDPVEYLWGVAQIAVWSLIEEGTGIVAGSLAALRPLLRHLPFLSSSRGGSYGASGSKSLSRRFRSLNKNEDLKMNRFQCAANLRNERRDHEQQSDGDSQRHILKETEVVVTSDEGRFERKRSMEYYVR